MGYADEIICAAVLRAISPSNNLRTYLESKKNLSVASLLEVMRSHFHEKDSTTVFTELSNASQDLNENCLDFVIRMMCLRQKVMDLGDEEGCPYDKKLVQTRFLHTLEVGIRNNNIRSELRESLCKVSISDEDLLKSVTEAVANETERTGKLARKPRDILINAVETDKVVEKKKKENTLQIQIQELKANQETELASLRNDLREIKSFLTMTENSPCSRSRDNCPPSGMQKGGNGSKRRIYKCSDCNSQGVPKCTHCFVCGSSEHRKAQCPRAVPSDQKNEW